MLECKERLQGCKLGLQATRTCRPPMMLSSLKESVTSVRWPSSKSFLVKLVVPGHKTSQRARMVRAKKDLDSVKSPI